MEGGHYNKWWKSGSMSTNRKMSKVFCRTDKPMSNRAASMTATPFNMVAMRIS